MTTRTRPPATDPWQARTLAAEDALAQVRAFIAAAHTDQQARTTEDCNATGCCHDGCEVTFCASCGQLDEDETGCLHRSYLDWLDQGRSVLLAVRGSVLTPTSWQDRAELAEAALTRYLAFVEDRHRPENVEDAATGDTVVVCTGCNDAGTGLGADGVCQHLSRLAGIASRLGLSRIPGGTRPGLEPGLGLGA